MDYFYLLRYTKSEMSNFLVIFFCLLAGLVCNKLKSFPANCSLVLNAFIIYISLPALVLSQLPKLFMTMTFSGFWWLPISMAWISFLVSVLIIGTIGKKLKWTKAKTGALILTAGLGNTSFVGFPILEALIGPKAIPIGILVDQPGSFLVLSTLGVAVAALFSGAQMHPIKMAKKVFSFPPFVALIISILWSFLNLKYFDFLSPSFEKIAMTLVPLALFSVGFQLRIKKSVLIKRARPLILGLFFKLFLMPLLFSFLLLKVLGENELTSQVTILESAMATMITSAVVATEFNLDSELANLMVGISIPLSFLTVPLWNYFLFAH
jgi:predicted permease